jgi:hypothetical protein
MIKRELGEDTLTSVLADFRLINGGLVHGIGEGAGVEATGKKVAVAGEVY